MNRALIRGPGSVALVDRPRPERSAEQVSIAVGACALCALEQRAYRGSAPAYPFAGGHEVGGTVIDAPPGAPPVGATVAVSLLPRCGRCPACRLGRDNLCAYLSEYNDVGDGPGGLSECVVAAAQDVVALAAQRTVLEAALVEPLACVLNSLRVASVGDGTRLAVIGNGFMGVLHARAARTLGASATILATGPAPAGLDGAWSGPVGRLDSERERLSRRGPLRGDWEFDVAIVIRGVRENLPLAGQLLRPGGTVSVFASQPIQEDIAIPSQILRKKELLMTAAASHRRQDFHRAAALVSGGEVVVADLVHRCFPLDAVAAAFDYAIGHDTGRVMVTMRPGGSADS